MCECKCGLYMVGGPSDQAERQRQVARVAEGNAWRAAWRVFFSTLASSVSKGSSQRAGTPHAEPLVSD
jgi:hypothetical protein